jgi:hypothetical protein
LEYWFLLVPVAAAFGLYSLIYVEPRYIGPFVVLLFVGIFASVRLPDSQEFRRATACVTIVMLAMLIASIGPQTYAMSKSTVRDLVNRHDTEPYLNWRVADGLKRIGVQQGEKVAVLNSSCGPATGPGRDKRSSDNLRWARLARIKIVAEVYSREDHNFWKMDPSTKKRVIQAFIAAGAKMIVDNEVPSWAAAEGWQRIGDTQHHVYFLSR